MIYFLMKREMKVLKKIFLVFVILFTIYGISIFIAPAFASQIDSLLWISGFSEKIRWGKEVYDNTITKDWNESYQKTKSGVIDAKDTVIDGVQTTKEAIDTVRQWAQQVQETLSGARESFDQTKQSLQEAGQAIGQIQEAAETLTNIWTTENEN